MSGTSCVCLKIARAALTARQIPSLSIPEIPVGLLTGSQRMALTPAQIQSIPGNDLEFITVDQVHHVTGEQMLSISSEWHFRKISDAVQAAFSRHQMLSLRSSVIAALEDLPATFGQTQSAPQDDHDHTDDVDPHHNHMDDADSHHSDMVDMVDDGHNQADHTMPHADDTIKQHEHMAAVSLVPPRRRHPPHDRKRPLV